ncbi:MAG: class I SAM-dependent methyltransferase [Candidatus Dojkabacteria bacterium]
MIRRKLKTLAKMILRPESLPLPFYEVGSKNYETREEWLERTIKTIPNGHKILDAGAGELRYKKYCTHLDYVSQDFAQYDGSGDGVGLQTQAWDNTKLDIISDIINIPVEDKVFDAIMCIEVFEHIPEPALAVKEFARIIKPGGKVIITAPFCSLTHFAPYHFGTGYSKYWYQEILGKYGFEINDVSHNGGYFDFLAQELRRTENIAKMYSNTDLDRKEQKLLNDSIGLMQKLKDKDTGSHELLTFGYHILATKK